MQLQPGEKSILAYFANDLTAMQALDSLRSQGFLNVRLDPITKTIKRRGISAPYLSDLTGGDPYDRVNGHGPLLAADPAVSGLSSSETIPEVYSYLLTVVTDDQGLPNARESLLAYGALLNG
jgi:hypothetical protein